MKKENFNLNYDEHLSFKFKAICEQFFAIKIHRFDEDNKKI